MSCWPERAAAGLALALLVACSARPLPERPGGAPGSGGGIDPGTSGRAGGTGGGGTGGGGTGGCAADPRLELVGSPLLVLDSPSSQGNLDTTLLWTGEEYLFVWRIVGANSIFMQRIDASGRGIGPNVRLRPYESGLDLAWGDGLFAAVWVRLGVMLPSFLMFQTFDRLGRPLMDPVTLAAVPGIPIDRDVTYGPRIVPISDGFAIVWYESLVFLATVDRAGNLRQAPIAAGGGDLAETPALSVAAADDRILVGWNGRPLSPPSPSRPMNVMTTRAYTSGLEPLGSATVLDESAGTTSGAHQLLPTPSGFLALWTRESVAIDGMTRLTSVRTAQFDRDGVATTHATMGYPVVGVYRTRAPAIWNRDHLAVLWDGGATGAMGDNGLTLSRFAPTGLRQGPSVNLPTMAPAGRLYVTAHDGTLGFIWSEEIGSANEVYFQQARSCP